jgi:hypothetical protein
MKQLTYKDQDCRVLRLKGQREKIFLTCTCHFGILDHSCKKTVYLHNRFCQPPISHNPVSYKGHGTSLGGLFQAGPSAEGLPERILDFLKNTHIFLLDSNDS